MLVALGLYLLGVTRALAFTERVGQNLWRVLQPLTRRFLPARTMSQAFPLGLLWGWLPCGLVYSALASAQRRFGRAGRLDDAGFRPRHLAKSFAGRHLLARLNEFVRRPAVRMPPVLLVLGFWLYGLLGLSCVCWAGFRN
jgi:hypothetical protein